MPAVDKCPECGVSMQGLDPVGHSLTHWNAELPRRADTLIARQKQARLLGQPEPKE